MKYLSKNFLKVFAFCAITLVTNSVFAQMAPIRGQSAVGVYENLVSDGAGHLIVNTNSAVTPTAVTFTNTTATILNSTTVAIAINAARKYLSIQNNDATGIIYCVPTAAATTALGIKILPAQMWNPSVTPANAINCIGSIASNANVIVTEGQ